MCVCINVFVGAFGGDPADMTWGLDLNRNYSGPLGAIRRLFKGLLGFIRPYWSMFLSSPPSTWHVKQLRQLTPKLLPT